MIWNQLFIDVVWNIDIYLTHHINQMFIKDKMFQQQY